jgi:hypothetical protein
MSDWGKFSEALREAEAAFVAARMFLGRQKGSGARQCLRAAHQAIWRAEDANPYPGSPPRRALDSLEKIRQGVLKHRDPVGQLRLAEGLVAGLASLASIAHDSLIRSGEPGYAERACDGG